MKIKFSKNNIFYMVFITIVVISILIIRQLDDNSSIEIQSTSNENIFYSTNSPPSISTPINSPSVSSKKEFISIYVVGEVNNPGTIVELEKGMLVNDAIKGAGGVTSNADILKINLVYKLTDNVMLKVLSKEEISSIEASTKSEESNSLNTGISLSSNSAGISLSKPSTDSFSNSKVNINKASLNILETLPGIGPETAKKIIDYRITNEPKGFKEINDIQKVPGIGSGKYNSLKDLITVD
jgi:competence protein ComEA